MCYLQAQERQSSLLELHSQPSLLDLTIQPQVFSARISLDAQPPVPILMLYTVSLYAGRLLRSQYHDDHFYLPQNALVHGCSLKSDRVVMRFLECSHANSCTLTASHKTC